MKKRLLSVFVFKGIFLLLFLNVQGQSNNTISGHVFNSERQPVSEIYVELLNEVNSVIVRKKTSSGGRYMFNGVSGGNFTVRVLTYGTELEEQTAEVNISTDGIAGRAPSENIQQDFYLRRRRNADNSPNVTAVVFVQDIPAESKKLYAKAIDSFIENKSTDGVNFLEQALKIFPDYYLALERLGQEYGAQEKWEASYNFFKKAVAINERSFSCWYGLSIATSQLQKSDEALTAVQKAVAINSSSIEAQFLLGTSLRKMQKFEDAEKSLQEANKLAKGKFADIHWNLALLYAHNLKKYAKAADHLEQFLKIKPNDAQSENVKKLIKQFRDKAAGN
ncbi:MAG: tetratricopeptide repeat protein [Acidobacteriota bacterium]